MYGSRPISKRKLKKTCLNGKKDAGRPRNKLWLYPMPKPANIFLPRNANVTRSVVEAQNDPIVSLISHVSLVSRVSLVVLVVVVSVVNKSDFGGTALF